jgi:hypothetical protein
MEALCNAVPFTEDEKGGDLAFFESVAAHQLLRKAITKKPSRALDILWRDPPDSSIRPDCLLKRYSNKDIRVVG